jgi:hypothetical protein
MSMAHDRLILSFTLTAAPAEMAVLVEADNVATELALETSWDEIETSAAFRAVFPDKASFDGLFDDPDFPEFCETICREDGYVWFAGDQADPHAIASLIQRAAPSALPFGFEWSVTGERLRVGDFGGGFFVVATDGIRGGSTRLLMEEALRA